MTCTDWSRTSAGKDVYELVKRKDLRGMSFGFNINKDEWNADHTVRTPVEIELHEVSIVALPAYPQTSIEARSIRLPADRKVLTYSGIVDPPVSEQERRRLELRLDLLRRL